MTTAGMHVHQDRLPRARGPQIVFLLLTTLFALSLGTSALVVSRYGDLLALDHTVQSRWTEVDEAYQRRADLAPSVVDRVEGVGGEARAQAELVREAYARLQPAPAVAPTASEGLARYQQAHEALGQAMAAALAVGEASPKLAASADVRALRGQLEGAEAELAALRERFNEAARTFNAARKGFPNSTVAALFGTRFAKKAELGPAAPARPATPRS